jgi:hypothetical protein
MKRAEEKNKKWKMPVWMAEYEKMIRNTGGNSVSELMNDHTTTMFENAPRAMLCVAVKSQVSLLELLYRSGDLIKKEPIAVKVERARSALAEHYHDDPTDKETVRYDDARIAVGAAFNVELP